MALHKRLAVLVFVACTTVFLCGLVTALKSFTVASDYNNQLRELGVDPSPVSVEDYIWSSVHIGVSKEEVLKRLKPLGQVNVAKMGQGCEGLAVNLQSNPWEYTNFDIPPDAISGCQIGLCYSGDQVSEILSFNRVDENGYVYSILATVEARATSNP